MEQLQQLPQRVEDILQTFESLREDLFDDNIGFIRKKIRQISRSESNGSLSNLNNYLLSVQQISEHCQSYWNGKERTADGYVRLYQQLNEFIVFLNPVISAHREQPEEIRNVINIVKLRLVQFLQVFISHTEEQRDLPKKKPAKRSVKKTNTPPPQQRKAPRTPQQRVDRAFERLDHENRRDRRSS